MNAHAVFLDAQTVKAQIAVLRYQHPEMDEDAKLLEDMIEGSTNFSEILSHLIRLERDAEAFADAIDVQISKLFTRHARYTTKQKNIRTMIQSLMEAGNQRKVTLPEATLSIANGRAGCVVTDIDALPSEFVRTERYPRKSELTAALLAGKRVQGAELKNPQLYLRIST